MNITVWSEVRSTTEVEVDFPVYVEWVFDHTTTFLRLDASGLLVKVTEFSRRCNECSRYEIEREHIDLTMPIDESLIGNSRRHRLCWKSTAAEFDAVVAKARQALDIGKES